MSSMGWRRLLLAGACSAVMLGTVGLARAAETPAGAKSEAKPAPASVSDKDWTDDWKQPTSWFKWGADERIRQEYLNNPFFYDTDPPGPEYNQLRVRSRIWGTVTPWDNFEAYIRLTNEARYYWSPESKPGDLQNASGDWDYSDILFDNLNIKLKNLFETKSTLTVGRQDFLTPQGAPSFGDGWLILDGTPLDGSRTVYFDAARLNIELESYKTNVDVVFINQYSDPDEWLSPINSESYTPLMEQDELGVILYARNKSIERTQIDGYFIYKHDTLAEIDNDIEWNKGDKGDIYTIGARVGHEFNKNWKANIEAAYQFGSRTNTSMFAADQDNKLSAWGMNSKVMYSMNDDWNNRFWAGLELLSGDDPGGTNTQFDPLWGRWPQWSELYIYSYATETRIGETTNLIHPQIGWGCAPAKDLSLTACYHPMWAFESTLHDRGVAGFSGDNFRGHLVTAVMKYRFNKHVGMHLWGEYLFAGDFYESEGARNDDDMAFLRWEFYFTF